MKCGDVTLFDACLNEDINANNEIFTDYERYILLGTQIRILLNMVPMDLFDIFNSEKAYDLF